MRDFRFEGWWPAVRITDLSSGRVIYLTKDVGLCRVKFLRTRREKKPVVDLMFLVDSISFKGDPEDTGHDGYETHMCLREGVRLKDGSEEFDEDLSDYVDERLVKVVTQSAYDWRHRELKLTKSKFVSLVLTPKELVNNRPEKGKVKE